MRIQAFFDPDTATISYVVYDRPGGHCAIIDPVLDFEYRSGRTRTVGADRIAAFVDAQQLTVQWLLETHAHADHLSAAAVLKGRYGGARTGIGRGIIDVQQVFSRVFSLGEGFALDGSQFDHLFEDDETFHIGSLTANALHVPGHTPADMAYMVGDAVFVGDTLFMPDVGTARCDFPGGDAATLYRSIRRLLDLPETTRMLMCHDYPPPGRGPVWETTVGQQRARNVHVREGITEEDFVAMRTTRDATLELPMLILPSIQINIRAGELPAPEANGRRYLKLPLDSF